MPRAPLRCLTTSPTVIMSSNIIVIINIINTFIAFIIIIIVIITVVVVTITISCRSRRTMTNEIWVAINKAQKNTRKWLIASQQRSGLATDKRTCTQTYTRARTHRALNCHVRSSKLMTHTTLKASGHDNDVRYDADNDAIVLTVVLVIVVVVYTRLPRHDFRANASHSEWKIQVRQSAERKIHEEFEDVRGEQRLTQSSSLTGATCDAWRSDGQKQTHGQRLLAVLQRFPGLWGRVRAGVRVKYQKSLTVSCHLLGQQ